MQLVDGFHHVHRNTDGTRLIGNGSGNGLANPPGSISTEFIAAMIIEFFHGFDQPQIAFLNQIEEKHTAADVAFGNADHQTEVGFCQTFFGSFITFFHALCQFDFLIGRKQRHTADLFEVHLHRVIDENTIGNTKVKIRFIDGRQIIRCFQMVKVSPLVNNHNSLCGKSRANIIILIRGNIEFRQCILDLGRFQIIPGFTDFNQLFHRIQVHIVVFFHLFTPSYRQGLVPVAHLLFVLKARFFRVRTLSPYIFTKYSAIPAESWQNSSKEPQFHHYFHFSQIL